MTQRAVLALPLAAALAAAACSSSPSPAPSPAGPVRDVGAAGGPVRVVPHRSEPFDSAKESAVWCATFALAWEALGRDVLKGAPDLGPPAPPEFVAGMNAGPLPKDIVDRASCIALAGFGPETLAEVRALGRAQFNMELPAASLPPLGPEDILAYAYLQKDLPFAHPFESLEAGVAFPGGADRVAAWGVYGGRDPREVAPVLAQVRLLHRTPENEPDAFVLEFRPRGGADRLLLARIPRPGTLGAAWEDVAERVTAGKARALHGNAKLRVPKVRFHLLRKFDELRGARVRNAGFEKHLVAEALQSIRFGLDETGAELASEAALLVPKGMAEPARERPDHFVLDGPFLVALLREGAAEPYFLAWIAGRELLAP